MFLLVARIIVKAAALLLGTLAGYAKDAIVGACHRTIDGQEHKISWRAGPEQDKIFTYVSQRAESMQGSHCRDEQVASRWQGTSCSCSFDSKVLGANCKRANNFHTVAVASVSRPSPIPFTIKEFGESLETEATVADKFAM